MKYTASHTRMAKMPGGFVVFPAAARVNDAVI
jgi:hypothetical protein